MSKTLEDEVKSGMIMSSFTQHAGNRKYEHLWFYIFIYSVPKAWEMMVQIVLKILQNVKRKLPNVSHSTVMDLEEEDINAG